MKKKGFTLVELLAVIAILAILVIIALPNVLGMFQSAKKNTFTTELQNIYKSATTQYVSDSMNRGAGSKASGIWYYRSHIAGQPAVACGSTAKLDLSGTETIDFFIQFDLSGKVIRYAATDGEFVFWYDEKDNGNKGLEIEKIGDKTEANTTVYTIADEAKKTDKTNYYTIDITTVTESDGVCGAKPTVQKKKENKSDEDHVVTMTVGADENQ